MQLAERMQLSTIRIDTTQSDGSGTGTGFFFCFKYDEITGQGIPCIVTNKHVIKDAITGRLRFSLIDAKGDPVQGKYCELQVNNFEKLWIPHPEEAIDLAILPLERIQQDIKKQDWNHIMYLYQ